MAVSTTSDGNYSISSGTAAEVLGVLRGKKPKAILGFHYDGTSYHVLYLDTPS